MKSCSEGFSACLAGSERPLEGSVVSINVRKYQEWQEVPRE